MRKPELNVAMISYHTCPLATLGGKDTGGMNVYVRELTKTLGAYNIHVDAFTRSQDEHIPSVLHDLGYGNRVVHIPAGPEVPLPKKELAEYVPTFAQGILEFAAKKGIKYDLIHTHYWMSGMAGKELQQKWNVPIIHMYHTLGVMKNRVAQSAAEVEGDYRLAGEKEVLENATRVVVSTPAEYRQLTTLYAAKPEKLVTIPPGVDTSHFYPIPAEEAKAVIGIPPDDRMLLFVGRIERLKGLETLIRAIAHMREVGVLGKCPHYLAVIGGEPDAQAEDLNTEMDRLQKLCGELGLGDLVVFLGKRNQNMLPYYYSAAEILILPSLYESFGMVALEAMACGTPVVASEVGGLAHLVKDGLNGYTVPEGDPITLGNKLTELIRHDGLRERLGQQANHYAQDFSWEKITEQMIQVYWDVLKNGTSSFLPPG